MVHVVRVLTLFADARGFYSKHEVCILNVSFSECRVSWLVPARTVVPMVSAIVDIAITVTALMFGAISYRQI